MAPYDGREARGVDMKMFSATDSSSTPENVWYAMPRP